MDVFHPKTVGILPVPGEYQLIFKYTVIYKQQAYLDINSFSLAYFPSENFATTM